MARLWNGPARFLFIPLIVEGRPGYDPPPAEYQEFIRRRVYFDPDPQTHEDRSLTSYINSISYGRASLDATVSIPITLNNLALQLRPALEVSLLGHGLMRPSPRGPGDDEGGFDAILG
jgi:hypothetical protein